MMAELGAPGEGHQRLQPMVGTFDARMKMWMAPDRPARGERGARHQRVDLRRALPSHELRGGMMGQAFQGMALTGFNNATGQYEGSGSTR